VNKVLINLIYFKNFNYDHITSTYSLIGCLILLPIEENTIMAKINWRKSHYQFLYLI